MAAQKKRPSQLSPKLRMACQEYTIDLNWSAAMVRAGYSEKTATKGSEYFKRPDVQALVAELSAARIQRIERDGDDVIEGLEQIAYGNVMDVFEYQPVHDDDPSGEQMLALKDLEKLPKSTTAMISSIKVTPPTAYSGAKTEVKFYSRLNALEMLGRHHQLFEKGTNGGIDFVMEMDLGNGNK